MGLRLIVWRFLLIKAFKRSGCASRTVHQGCSKSERTRCILLFGGCIDKALSHTLAGLEAPNWPGEDISTNDALWQLQVKWLGPFTARESVTERVKRFVFQRGAFCYFFCGAKWRERVLCLLWALSNILWWQGPVLKPQILDHIWSKVLDVCLYMSYLAPRIKFLSPTRVGTVF